MLLSMSQRSNAIYIENRAVEVFIARFVATPSVPHFVHATLRALCCCRTCRCCCSMGLACCQFALLPRVQMLLGQLLPSLQV
jgi:hypothetical protein